MGDRKRQRCQETSGFETNRFGARLSEWRSRRRESQLSLAIEANVSQRHLSFVESGRARPSREMVLRLCEALEVPLRSRNELFVLAGYAPHYPHLSLDDIDMQGVREALDRMIGHHEPYPAFVVDREWRVVMSNRGAMALVSACFDAPTLGSLSQNGSLNLMRMMFEPSQMRPRIRNWEKVAPLLLARLRREAQSDPLSPSLKLLKELSSGIDLRRSHGGDDPPLSPTVALEPRDRWLDLEVVQHDNDVRNSSGRRPAGAPDRDVLSCRFGKCIVPADVAGPRAAAPIGVMQYVARSVVISLQ